MPGNQQEPASQPTQPMTVAERVNKQHLELLVEVRALANAVSQLHTIFVRRRVLYWVLGIETLIVTCALAALGVFVVIEFAHQNALVSRTMDSCRTRNAQIDSTKTFLSEEFAIQAESGQLTAMYLRGLHFTVTPEEKKLAAKVTQDQTAALHRWYTSQPPDVPCSQFRGGG